MDELGLPTMTGPEEQLIEGLLNPPNERSWRHLSLGFVLGKWRRLVAAVEEGYSGNVDDYWYDLTWRDRLESVLAGLPDATKRKVAQVLDLLDERFNLATRSDESDLLGQYYAHGSGWWWRRLPIKVQGLFAESLGFGGDQP